MTVDEDNEIEKAKRLTALRDRARAFRQVFASPLGIVVLSEIRAAFKYADGIPKNVVDDHNRTDELQTHRKLGEYSVIRWIEIQIESKEIEHVNPGRAGD